MSFFSRIRPDPGFVSPVRSDPGFVSPIRSDPGFDSPIRSDPVRSWFCQRPVYCKGSVVRVFKQGLVIFCDNF